MQRRARHILLTIFLVGAIPSTMLWATPTFDPSTSSCAAINCLSVSIGGIVRAALNEEAHPRAMEVFPRQR